MRIRELTKEQLMYLLINEKPFSQGQFGKLTLIGDKLYKINYKQLIDTYLSKDESKLDEEVDSLLSIESIINSGLYDAEFHAKKFERLKDTKMKDLITGVLAYKGLYVGVEMNYYNDYISLASARKMLDESSLNICLNHILEMIDDLLANNIVPKDIREDNILINTTTLDLVIVDLDGMETVYGPENYVQDYPYTKRTVMKKYEEMKNRVLGTQEFDR